jgi:hypothetical protein
LWICEQSRELHENAGKGIGNNYAEAFRDGLFVIVENLWVIPFHRVIGPNEQRSVYNFPDGRSSGRPRERTPGQQVEMNMENGLTGVSPIIDHHTISTLLKTLLHGNRFCNKEEVADDLAVSDHYAMNVSDMLLRNNEHMDRCLGIQILEGDRIFVLMQNICRHFLFDDLAEDAGRVNVHGVLS